MLSEVRSSAGRSPAVEASLPAVITVSRNGNFDPRLEKAELQNQVLGTRYSQLATLYFFLTFVPIRNNFRTVPVGSRFI